jgi:hypothetical protein
MKLLLPLLCASMLPLPAMSAGLAAHTTIVKMHVRRSLGDIAFIQLAAVPLGHPACAVGAPWHFTLALNTETEKKIFAVLLAAQISGTPVTIDGTGSCSEYGTFESMDSVVLEE